MLFIYVSHRINRIGRLLFINPFFVISSSSIYVLLVCRDESTSEFVPLLKKVEPIKNHLETFK